MAAYPEVTYRYPTVNDSNVTELRPQIILDWSEDIELTQFQNASTRNQLLTIIDEVTKTSYSTDYVEYQAVNRRLVLQVATDLQVGTTYRVFLKALVLGSAGRKSKNEYSWTFSLAQTALPYVVLTNPPDVSIQSVFPSLTWEASAFTVSAMAYEVQLDDLPTFQSVDYTATTTGTAITPAGVFNSATTYYWRVRTYADPGTSIGPWSPISSFYFGDSAVAHSTSKIAWEDSDSFGVKSTSFKNGLTHQSTMPNVTLYFTSTPASNYSTSLEVVKLNQVPRNDSSTAYDETTVTGSWTLNGTALTFTFGESIAENTRYELRVNSTMENTLGLTLGEDYNYYWSGKYNPYYVGLRTIRARLMASEQQVPDDLINYYIYLASLEAKARVYGYAQLIQGLVYAYDTLKESVVRDTPNLDSFGALKWVEAATVYKLTGAILIEELRNVGRSRTLGDYSEALTKDFLAAIQEAQKQAKEEMVQYENYLTPSSVSMGVTKNSGWSDLQHLWDPSLGDAVGGHNAPF